MIVEKLPECLEVIFQQNFVYPQKYKTAHYNHEQHFAFTLTSKESKSSRRDYLMIFNYIYSETDRLYQYTLISLYNTICIKDYFSSYNIKEMQNKQLSALGNFLKQYQQEITNTIKEQPSSAIIAQILDQSQVELAAIKIQNGELVAFPTETVYGLGANAFDQVALKKIYETKKRPLTDPIIVHVLNAEEGEKLVIMNEYEKKIFDLLTKRFWPGPLTIILQANLDLLPLIVTAQTGFVGIRAPKHPYARKLIEACKLPIGAPSANLFSHVSPTEPVHVFNDFYDSKISIVNGQRCEYGVESTVIKVVSDEIHILRQGSLLLNNLQSYLKSALPENQLPKVLVHRRVQNEKTNMQAPGQLLKHYAPYLPCYYVSSVKTSQENIRFKTKTNQESIDVSQIAFISFNQDKFSGLSHLCKHYFQVSEKVTQNQKQIKEEQNEQNLFCSKQQKIKMRQIYFLLRKCQNLSVTTIIIGWGESKQGTVWDKIFRSTQSQQITVEN